MEASREKIQQLVMDSNNNNTFQNDKSQWVRMALDDDPPPILFRGDYRCHPPLQWN